MTTIVQGCLRYLGWQREWLLLDENGTAADLRAVIEPVFAGLVGRRADHNYLREGYELAADDASSYLFEMEQVPVLVHEKVGFSNVAAYMDNIFCRLNGRQVVVTTGADRLQILADEADEVPGVYYTDGNVCAVADDMVTAVCKPGTVDACIFLTADAGGFECAKFSSLARHLLERLAAGTMRANRIGNCKCLGRKR